MNLFITGTPHYSYTFH